MVDTLPRDHTRAEYGDPPRVVIDLLSLSDGTLATLVQANDYETLDAVRYTWFAWALEMNTNGPIFTTWQDAWHMWLAYQRPAAWREGNYLPEITWRNVPCAICTHEDARAAYDPRCQNCRQINAAYSR